MRRSEIKKPIEVTTVLKKNVILPLVASIPHSSTFIPTEIRRSFLISDNELEQEFLALTDRYADELFSGVYEIGGVLVRYN